MITHIALISLLFTLSIGLKCASAFAAAPRIVSPSRTRRATFSPHRHLLPGSIVGRYVSEEGNNYYCMPSSEFTKLQSVTSDDDRSPSSPTKLSRQHFVSIAYTAMLASAAPILCPPIHPQPANADDPSNLYYKSKADEEEPLVVFGKSLQNINVEASSGPSDAPSSKDASSSLSFSDIALPSSSDAPYSAPPMGGGDLNNALKEKKESRNRAIDPRTHG